MSTRIESALAAGLLVKWNPILRPGDCAKRTLYATADFDLWARQMNSSPPPPRWSFFTTPGQQLQAFAAEFVSGGRLTNMHKIIPEKKGGWSVNLSGLKLVGWVPERLSLVLVCGCTIRQNKIDKEPGFSKSEMLEKTVKFRERHRFGPPILGEIASVFY